MNPALLLLPLLAACSGAGSPDCTDNGQCGEGQACVGQACTDVECLSSEQCDIQQYCRTKDESYACTDGCVLDEDCAAGESCDVAHRRCTSYGCRSTVLDCPVGTTCNASTAECEAWDGALCQETCDVYDQPRCSAGATCQAFTTGESCERDADCAEGNCDMFLTSDVTCRNLADCPDGTEQCLLTQCVSSSCHTDYCLPRCTAGDSGTCPAGFSCESDGAGAWLCFGDCQYYLDNGYL
jgi:hypothetical protein